MGQIVEFRKPAQGVSQAEDPYAYYTPEPWAKAPEAEAVAVPGLEPLVQMYAYYDARAPRLS